MSKQVRILLADDSRFFRAIERKFLEKTPAEIIEAVDSDEVLARAWQDRPDLIYMGFSLRPLDGANCCRKLKMDPELERIPVVVICDQDSPDQADSATEAGADAVMFKPLDKHRFLQSGRQFLDEIREHRTSCFFPVTVLRDDEELTGKCLDISRGGMFLESQEEIAVGTELRFSFKLPGEVAVPTLECRGVVTWLNRRPNPMKPHYPQGLGIKFVKLPDHVQVAIRALLDK